MCLLRLPTILFLTVSALSLHAQNAAPALVGRVEDNKYLSPTRAFQVTIPILPELGGSISDTDNVVSFQDAFNIHETIACFKMDATQRWEYETRGRKEYLGWFFSNFIQSDFEKHFPGAQIESAAFLTNVESGALYVCNLLPGGSLFTSRATLYTLSAPLVAKRGNLVFIHDETVYLLSIELAEKVLERTAYDKTITEEDALLHQRLMRLLSAITFTSPPTLPVVEAKYFSATQTTQAAAK